MIFSNIAIKSSTIFWAENVKNIRDVLLHLITPHAQGFTIERKTQQKRFIRKIEAFDEQNTNNMAFTYDPVFGIYRSDKPKQKAEANYIGWNLWDRRTDELTLTRFRLSKRQSLRAFPGESGKVQVQLLTVERTWRSIETYEQVIELVNVFGLRVRQFFIKFRPDLLEQPKTEPTPATTATTETKKPARRRHFPSAKTKNEVKNNDEQ